MARQWNIVVIGAGAGGLNAAGRIKRLAPSARVTVIDPAEFHYYQPLWTFVGGGVYPREHSQRRMADVIPPGWNGCKRPWPSSSQRRRPSEPRAVRSLATMRW